MGYPMTGWLAKQGHEVCVYNRTHRKIDAWLKGYSGKSAFTPKDAVRDADMVFLCLGDDPDVKAVINVARKGISKGAVVIDHTTGSPSLARALYESFKQDGVGFVDAPVSGGQAGAENGKLSIMCGGDAEDICAVRPILEAYAERIVHIGSAGHGQLCKAVNQICIAGLLQGLSEGVHFAQLAGLDIDKTLEAISGGAAQSWQMENRAKTMAANAFDFGFAVDWMRKDLRIALHEARETGAQLPVTALVDQFYADIQALGGGRQDTSSLIRRLGNKRD